MEGMTVVPAGLDRLDELVEFWVLLHQHQTSTADPVEGLDMRSDEASSEIVREIYRAWLTDGSGFAFLAERDGRAVGYLVGFYEEPHFMWDTGRMGHIDSFYVLPEGRGLGIGRLLMERTYEEMRASGATSVALEVVAKNDQARRFYERDGFTTTFVQMLRRLPREASTDDEA